MVETAAFDELVASPHAVAFPDSEPRVVKLSLSAGERVDPHQHPDREIVCFVESGRLTMAIGDDEYDLEAGDIARFDGAQDISPTAVEDSDALLVLAERTE